MNISLGKTTRVMAISSKPFLSTIMWMKMSMSLSKSMSMGTSIRMKMKMKMSIRMRTSISMMMRMNIRTMVGMSIKMMSTRMMMMCNLDNFFHGSLSVCKGDLALDAEKLNKPDCYKYNDKNYHHHHFGPDHSHYHNKFHHPKDYHYKYKIAKSLSFQI